MHDSLHSSPPTAMTPIVHRSRRFPRAPFGLGLLQVAIDRPKTENKEQSRRDIDAAGDPGERVEVCLGKSIETCAKGGGDRRVRRATEPGVKDRHGCQKQQQQRPMMPARPETPQRDVQQWQPVGGQWPKETGPAEHREIGAGFMAASNIKKSSWTKNVGRMPQ